MGQRVRGVSGSGPTADTEITLPVRGTRQAKFNVVDRVKAPGWTLSGSVAALDGDAVAEAGGSWVVVGTNAEIHLTHRFARWCCERPKLGAGAGGGLHRLINHLEVASIAEFQEGLNRVGAGVAIRGVGGEKQFESAVGLARDEVGVPVLSLIHI